LLGQNPSGFSQQNPVLKKIGCWKEELTIHIHKKRQERAARDLAQNHIKQSGWQHNVP
jgi:hypothetical protein